MDERLRRNTAKRSLNIARSAIELVRILDTEAVDCATSMAVQTRVGIVVRQEQEPVVETSSGTMASIAKRISKPFWKTAGSR